MTQQLLEGFEVGGPVLTDTVAETPEESRDTRTPELFDSQPNAEA